MTAAASTHALARIPHRHIWFPNPFSRLCASWAVVASGFYRQAGQGNDTGAYMPAKPTPGADGDQVLAAGEAAGRHMAGKSPAGRPR
jgi:hypothetical protein